MDNICWEHKCIKMINNRVQEYKTRYTSINGHEEVAECGKTGQRALDIY